MEASKSKPPQRMARTATTPPSEITAISDVPPPTSTTMLPTGSWMAQPRPDGGRHGLLDEEAGRRPGPPGRLLDGTPLHRGDGRGHADEHLGPVQPAHPDPAQQHAEHPLGDLEVGDGAAAQRALGHDVARRPPDHLPGVGADGQHLAAARVQRDHGGLVEHEALSLGVDERVGRPQIDGQVA